MSPSGVANTAQNARLPFRASTSWRAGVLGLVFRSILSLIPRTCLDSVTAPDPLALSLGHLPSGTCCLLCREGPTAAGPGPQHTQGLRGGGRVAALTMAALPVKANLSSSIFFLRCLISKSLSFNSLYSRPFSSAVSLS